MIYDEKTPAPTIGLSAIVVEDHPLMRTSLATLLVDLLDFKTVVECSDASEALKEIHNQKFDLGIFDVVLPGMNVFDLIKQSKSLNPRMKALVLTGYMSADILQRGQLSKVDGFASKATNPEDLLNIINNILDDKDTQMCQEFSKLNNFQENFNQKNNGLTCREREILDYTLAGMSIKEISTTANISSATVKKHRQHILNKLNFPSTTKLVAYSNQTNLDTMS